MTVASDRITRVFNRSEAIQTVALVAICPRLSTGFVMLLFFTNLRLMEYLVRYLVSFYLS